MSNDIDYASSATYGSPKKILNDWNNDGIPDSDNSAPAIAAKAAKLADLSIVPTQIDAAQVASLLTERAAGAFINNPMTTQNDIIIGGTSGAAVREPKGALGTAVIVKPDGNVGFSGIVINAQTGTTYTLALADSNQMVSLNNASAITLTIPANATIAFPVNTAIALIQLGAGQVTVSPAANVTLTSRGSVYKLAGQDAMALLIKIGTDSWVLTGDISA